MNTENQKHDAPEYTAESIIDREYFRKLPIAERSAYVLNAVVETISDAVQSGALRGNSSCNPLVGILEQAREESGITITLHAAMRKYRQLSLEHASA